MKEEIETKKTIQQKRMNRRNVEMDGVDMKRRKGKRRNIG